MVILCMALLFAMPVIAMEPTGPPGEVVMVGSNLSVDIAVVQVAGVTMNHPESAISLYAVPGSNPGMLAGLMCGYITSTYTLIDTCMAKDYYLRRYGYIPDTFVG